MWLRPGSPLQEIAGCCMACARVADSYFACQKQSSWCVCAYTPWLEESPYFSDGDEQQGMCVSGQSGDPRQPAITLVADVVPLGEVHADLHRTLYTTTTGGAIALTRGTNTKRSASAPMSGMSRYLSKKNTSLVAETAANAGPVRALATWSR